MKTRDLLWAILKLYCLALCFGILAMGAVEIARMVMR